MTLHILVKSQQDKTRQLPMGAGHCQFGGFTDRNVCNIHGEGHLAAGGHVTHRRARYTH